jgi:hypothetical protein
MILEHCQPFNISLVRGDERHTGAAIWTAERDIEMWRSLRG